MHLFEGTEEKPFAKEFNVVKKGLLKRNKTSKGLNYIFKIK